jgi:hypothetical protein
MRYDLALGRMIDAPSEAISHAFADRNAQSEWSRENAVWSVGASIDLAAGGRWDLALGMPDVEPYRESSVSARVDTPRRLGVTTTHARAGREDIRHRPRYRVRGAMREDALRHSETGFQTAELDNLLADSTASTASSKSPRSTSRRSAWPWPVLVWARWGDG